MKDKIESISISLIIMNMCVVILLVIADFILKFYGVYYENFIKTISYSCISLIFVFLIILIVNSRKKCVKNRLLNNIEDFVLIFIFLISLICSLFLIV